ncbi:MAG: ATP-binding cassette domain-containing protein [Bacteroidales bacterium]|nr:ATP-binding cassette domain-containing protein [Bacteroidales bacterium]
MTENNTPVEEPTPKEQEVENIVNKEETPATPAADYVISVNEADIYQGKNLILNKVSLHISNGELVYLVGKTGSGKSNLLKLLYCDVPVVNGEVKVAGFDLYKIKSRNIQKLRRELGIVFQDFQLLQDRNVYENLKFITRVTGWKDKTARDERINEVLTMVGLETKGFKMPHQLSGGEQQRVCIARALVNNPKIILADEPTGNLDPETSYDIFALLRDIAHAGTSVLIATHDYLIINQIPSRVIKIENGKVFE